MKIKLYSDTKLSPYSTKVQVCLNRGMNPQEISTYLNNSFNEINPAEAFGEDLLKQGAKLLIGAISANKPISVIVDCDVDGMTSSAILINWLYENFPAAVRNNLTWYLHEGKSHGLPEFIDSLVQKEPGLVICPDSATNDLDEIKRLHDLGTEVLILDHHLSNVGLSEYAVTINSQYNYPNPELSGAGVVWQFCRYIDKLLQKDTANKFLDLVACGLESDMMDIRSLETKELIFLGFRQNVINNPLLYSLREKNSFSLSKSDYEPSSANNLDITPMGCSFFITPLLNAVCRSGTIEEKELVFKALLTMCAFEEVPSTKRGHKLGEKETIVTQATRQLTNIKNRQERSVEHGMEILNNMAADMLDNKVLVFEVDNEILPSTIRGLAANKLMAKYQRPCCVVSKTEVYENSDDILPWEETTEKPKILYQGSMRGYTATGIKSFKEVAEGSDSCSYVAGHDNAAGIGITDIDSFVGDMNEALRDISTDIVYYVDYIYDADSINPEAILYMSDMNDYIGTGFPRPQVYVEKCRIENFTIMKEKHLKINLPRCDAIMWGADSDLLDRLQEGEIIVINFVATCCKNNYNWQITPQLIVKDWEEVTLDEADLAPAAAWGF